MKHLFRGLATLVAVTAFVAVVGSIGSASNRAAGCHTYLVHQRYWYPRRFREYIYGWATTVVMRDDGASMRGYAQLGIRADHNTEGINWESVPTCSPPHH